MPSISKRQFLKLMLLPFAQALTSCLYHNEEDMFPDLVILLKSSAFLTDFNGMTLVSEDEITIEWTDSDVYPMTLMFSPDKGNNWHTLHTVNDDTPYTWKIPQLNTNEAMLKLVSSIGDTLTEVFNIIPSLVISLSSYPHLIHSGNHQVLTTTQHGDIVIRNTGNGFMVLSLICTHSGCTAQYGPEIYCSCHGSRFTIEGDVINGPASRSLKRFGNKHLSVQGKLLVYEL